MFALALSDRITGVEGHFSLMNAFSFNSLSKISVKVKKGESKDKVSSQALVQVYDVCPL